MINVRPLSNQDRAWVESRVTQLFHGPTVVSRSRVHEPSALPGFIARDGNEIVGLTTFEVSNGQCEIVTLDALRPGAGVGTALLKAVIEEAAGQSLSRLWLITTNDNLNALRFYQMRGFKICGFYPRAVEASRKIKPQIPRLGNFGIEISDEIELEKLLAPVTK